MIIAVVDSGVEKTYSEQNCFIYRKIGYSRKNSVIVRDDDNVFDQCGHGTMSIDCIHRICPESFIVSIKILDEDGRTDVLMLEKALDDLKGTDVNIINLSLSLTNDTYDNLESLCKSLAEEGKIIVASTKNGSFESLPAAFPDVIGVRGIALHNLLDHYVKKYECIELFCDSSPIMVRGLNNHLNMFLGNSKATCVATALIAKLAETHKINSNKFSILEQLEKTQIIRIESDLFDYCGQIISPPLPREEVLQFGSKILLAEQYCCDTFHCQKNELYEKRLFFLGKVTSEFLENLLHILLGDKIYSNTTLLSYRDFEWFYSALYTKEFIV